jgi:hypothetical protein
MSAVTPTPHRVMGPESGPPNEVTSQVTATDADGKTTITNTITTTYADGTIATTTELIPVQA